MKMEISVTSFTGASIQELIPEIARLRIEVFREYPFLYAGDYAYEMRYLDKFRHMEDAILVGAFDQKRLVGVSTGYPFRYETEDFKRVFSDAGRNPDEYFCFGESVLQKVYRGQGIGGEFFNQREAHIARLGRYRSICFYTSLRPANDPKRPPDYRPLAPFWQRRGFAKHPELIGTASYKEIGEAYESPKQMVFWIKGSGS